MLDFSKWAFQDTEKSPLPSVASSDYPPPRWLGVQSLASIVTGRDGKVVVCNAAKRNVHFELGYVEGRRQQTHIVKALDAPRAVVNLFSNELAKKVLRTPSFLHRLEEAGGANLSLGIIIDRVLAELDVYTPEEFEAMKTFCATCGFEGDDKLPLRVARFNGELVMALIDAVMLAKKCTYEAAQRICHRLLLDHWNFDMEVSGIFGQTNLSSQIFHSIRLQEGSHGGGATTCVGPATLAEVLILIPGCELSAQLRKDMVKSFFGVGGNRVTFESLLSNPRIQAHLRGSDHPLGEFLEDGEHKALVRKLPRIWLQQEEEARVREEMWITTCAAFEQRVALLELTLERAQNARDDRLMSSLRDYSAHQLEAVRASFSDLLTSRFSSFILSLANHVNSSVTAAVAAGLGLKRAQPKKRTTSAADMPEEQRATPLQTGPLSLGLSTVALTMFPEMPFAVWRKIRGSFGHHSKKERLRLHALGEQHPQYVAMPLLWAYTGSGSTVEGGGIRYVYLAEHGALLQRVFRTQLQTSRSQRNSGAPAPTESLEQRAHRLAAHLSPAERGVQWPVHVAELEPQWNEGEEGV